MTFCHIFIVCCSQDDVMQADRLDGFSCREAEVQHHYKQKHLRTAFTQLPGAKDTSSTVSSKVRPDTSIHERCACVTLSAERLLTLQ